ncbi:unnamed protein product [Protopolystoma xenopodis]|uniref:Uncharacterized protein n=1 Tax=Protopolystoma xenopodis TaxID=117903 RepID=A0A448XM39_9PLAT|nr:unnamed protein product [Protopolystoma xenopodis]
MSVGWKGLASWARQLKSQLNMCQLCIPALLSLATERQPPPCQHSLCWSGLARRDWTGSRLPEEREWFNLVPSAGPSDAPQISPSGQLSQIFWPTCSCRTPTAAFVRLMHHYFIDSKRRDYRRQPEGFEGSGWQASDTGHHDGWPDSPWLRPAGRPDDWLICRSAPSGEYESGSSLTGSKAPPKRGRRVPAPGTLPAPDRPQARLGHAVQHQLGRRDGSVLSAQSEPTSKMCKDDE